jgi:hypothetical protein
MAKKITQVRAHLISMGDSTRKTHEETDDLKAALVAVKAYSEAIRSSIVQVHYKRLTGTPTKIEFLEE